MGAMAGSKTSSGGAVVIHGLACVYKRLQLVYVAMVTAPVLVVIGQQEYLFRSRDMQVSEHPANQQPNLGSLAVRPQAAQWLRQYPAEQPEGQQSAKV